MAGQLGISRNQLSRHDQFKLADHLRKSLPRLEPMRLDLDKLTGLVSLETGIKLTSTNLKRLVEDLGIKPFWINVRHPQLTNGLAVVVLCQTLKQLGEVGVTLTTEQQEFLRKNDVQKT